MLLSHLTSVSRGHCHSVLSCKIIYSLSREVVQIILTDEPDECVLMTKKQVLRKQQKQSIYLESQLNV